MMSLQQPTNGHSNDKFVSTESVLHYLESTAFRKPVLQVPDLRTLADLEKMREDNVNVIKSILRKYQPLFSLESVSPADAEILKSARLRPSTAWQAVLNAVDTLPAIDPALQEIVTIPLKQLQRDLGTTPPSA